MKMLTKIRLQFIFIASAAVMGILIVFVGIFNSFELFQNNREIANVLDLLAQNEGDLPDEETLKEELQDVRLSVNQVQQLNYFSYTVDSEEAITSSDLEHIRDFTASDLEEFAQLVDYGGEDGLVKMDDNTYTYRVQSQSDQGLLVLVLDTSTFVHHRSDLFSASIELSLYSLILFVLIVFVFAGRAIKPYVENAEKQKRFIANAGHELKTPLAIISANTEMQELLDGETEWSKSTKDQVFRMTELINRMVTLAKMEEQPDIVLSTVDFSQIAEDAAEDFKAALIKDGKDFEMDIQPGIQVKAEEKSLFELVTILVDNACKYCDPGGKVQVRLNQTPLRQARFEVSNTYAEGSEVDYSRFFNRFYREDESHNSQVSGFGIGLSMAEGIVKIFKGKISVHYKGDTITFRVIL